MKILRNIGIGIAVLVLAILGAALIAPSENNMSRSVVINAPAKVVRANIMSFEGMLRWSPWHHRDPNQTYSIENDGQVGALYTWSGEDSLVGEGSQTITEIDENSVNTHLHFVRPFESEADAKAIMEKVDDGVKVTWHYHDETPYPLNIFNLFFDMEKMLGPDFEEGMMKLKEISEDAAPAEPAVYRGLEVRVEEMPDMLYVGIKDTVSWDEMGEFFDKAYGSIYPAVQEAGLEMTGMPSGIYFDWDTVNQSTVLMAAIPVKEGQLDGFASFGFNPGSAVVVDYYGSYEDGEKPHKAIEDFLKDHPGLSTSIAIEEYVTDPAKESDSSKWLTRVMYPISE